MTVEFVYVAPDGKGGTFTFSATQPDRVPRPPPYEPWTKEWRSEAAKHVHVMWTIRWYQQEVRRLKLINLKMRRTITKLKETTK